jgi:hypothetical protein
MRAARSWLRDSGESVISQRNSVLKKVLRVHNPVPSVCLEFCFKEQDI